MERFVQRPENWNRHVICFASVVAIPVNKYGWPREMRLQVVRQFSGEKVERTAIVHPGMLKTSLSTPADMTAVNEGDSLLFPLDLAQMRSFVPYAIVAENSLLVEAAEQIQRLRKRAYKFESHLRELQQTPVVARYAINDLLSRTLDADQTREFRDALERLRNSVGVEIDTRILSNYAIATLSDENEDDWLFTEFERLATAGSSEVEGVSSRLIEFPASEPWVETRTPERLSNSQVTRFCRRLDVSIALARRPDIPTDSKLQIIRAVRHNWEFLRKLEDSMGRKADYHGLLFDFAVSDHDSLRNVAVKALIWEAYRTRQPKEFRTKIDALMADWLQRVQDPEDGERMIRYLESQKQHQEANEREQVGHRGQSFFEDL